MQYEDVSLIVVLVASLVGIGRWKQLEVTLRYLLGLVLFELCLEILSRGLGMRHQSNLFLFPIDTAVEFGLLAWMYRRALRFAAVSRWLPAVIGIFTLVSLFSYAEPAKLNRFNAVQRFAESLLVLGLVLLYFYKVIRELVIVHLEREPMFWISVGLLLYFAGNVLIFISSNYILSQSKALSLRFWGIHAVLYSILNGLYAWALWISPSSKK